MQKIRYLILALLCAVAQGAWAQGPSGNWTDEGNYSASLNKVSTENIPGDEGIYDYYVYISSAADLARMAYEINDGGYQDDNEMVMFKLTRDLDMSAHYWTPIGTGEVIQNGNNVEDEDHNSFRVAFDGQGHTISGITVNRSDADYNGLFGYVDFLGEMTSVIQNVVLTNCSVTGKDYTGGVVGYANLIKMNNVHCDATVSGADKVGGLVGEVYCGEEADNPIYDCLYLGNSISATGSNKGLLFGKYTNLNADMNYYTSSSLTALNGKDVRAYTMKTGDLPSGVSVSFSGGNGINYDGKYYVPSGKTVSVSATAGQNLTVTDILVDGVSIKSGDKYQFMVDGKKNEYVVTALVITGTGTQDDPYQISNETSLKSVITDGVYIKLVEDIALSEKLEIGSGKTVTIDLNGKTLSRSLTANENYGMVIYVNGGKLTIKDGSGDNSGSIEGGRSYNGAGILCESGSTLTIKGGTFTNNDVSRTDNGNQGRGGAIFMNPNTTLTVTGGVFDGNSAYNGGAIYLDDGSTIGGTAASATISGAEFKNCWVTGDGGAIYNKGTLTVSNCTFSGNKATGVSGSGGGGLWNSSGSMLILTDCTIIGNECKGNGGGVNIHGDATITDCTITSNTAGSNGGGIYVDASGKTVTLSGSNTIQSNTATNYGGGVYIYSGSTISMSGNPKITGNENGNLYLDDTNVITCGTFESGASIGVSLANGKYNRAFTSGFGANNSGAQPDDYFSVDLNDATLSLNNGEAYIAASGYLYVECTWSGGDTDGHVVKTTKLATNVKEYTDTEDLSEGWYLLKGNQTFSDRPACHGDVKFILQDGCDVEFKKGIHIDKDKNLTIYAQGGGTGKLRATGGGGSASNGDAAIGGNNEVVGGKLIIHGGTITAKPSHNCAAGIGGGDGNSGMQQITIYDGNITAEGSSSGAGIGGGENNNYTPVTIYGGTVTATGGNYAAGIGGGEDGTNGTIKIYGGTVTATGGKNGAGIGSGEERHMKNNVVIFGGTVTATGGENAAGIGGGYKGGMRDINSIEIKGGTVIATGGNKGAGIGCGDKAGYDNWSLFLGTDIYISGGTIYATGGDGGAGIGSGESGAHLLDKFEMTGGKLYATGDRDAPAIGSCYNYDGYQSNEYFSNTIEINGYLEAKCKGGDAACIGGSKGFPGGKVKINGGTVKCIYTNEYSGEYSNNRFIGQGGDIVDEYQGTLSLPGNYSVDIDGSKATSGNRKSTCQSHPSGYSVLTIQACEHSGANYTFKDEEKHTFNCSYCDGSEENHDTDGEGGSCSKCGKGSGQYTITLYEANKEGTGYSSTPITYTTALGVSFNLPECTTALDKKVFVGWKEADDTPSSVVAEDEELSSLKDAGSSSKVIENVTYYARYQAEWEGDGIGTSEDPYQIKTKNDWDFVANKVKGGKISYKGKYFKLMNDISVTTMIGTSDNAFRGNFNGDSKTLTVSYDTSDQFAAPFQYTYGATIQNLKTAGTIKTSGTNAGGVVGRNGTSSLTLYNVNSSVTINSSVSGNACHGGLVGYAINANIERCAFTGKLLGNNSKQCGGLLGYKSNTSGSSVTIKNCLFLPSEVTVSTDNSYIFATGSTSLVNISNSYYTQTLGTAQGTQAYTIKSGHSEMRLYFNEIEHDGEDEAIAKLQEYENDIFPFDTGLLFLDKFYTGAETEVTFTPIMPIGYVATDVTATEGELTDNGNGSYKLTMNSANSVINATKTEKTYEILTLYDVPSTVTNTTTIEGNVGKTMHAKLDGRTLFKDGYWNTLCLPFDVSSAQIQANDNFKDCIIMELDVDGKYNANGVSDENGTFQTGFDAATGTLYLYFKPVTEMKDGVPYIVRWDKPEGYDDNPSAYDFTPEFPLSEIRGSEPDFVESKDGKVRLIGNYDPVGIASLDMTKLYLDTGSRLLHPNADTSINAFRAYFQLAPSLGDVNGDGVVSVTDVTLLVSHILGNEDDGFILENADANGDGIISVSDVTVLVNIILNTGNQFSVVVHGADGFTFDNVGSGPARDRKR